jgi:hypothetical protein
MAPNRSSTIPTLKANKARPFIAQLLRIDLTLDCVAYHCRPSHSNDVPTFEHRAPHLGHRRPPRQRAVGNFAALGVVAQGDVHDGLLNAGDDRSLRVLLHAQHLRAESLDRSPKPRSPTSPEA